MTITGYDHVQVAIPRGGEDLARAFYGGLLGMREVPKPPALAVRGGCWFSAGSAVLHLGVEEPFTPARKAHPAFVVEDLAAVRSALEAAGHECVDGSGELPGTVRCHAHDPFGNRLEFQQGSPDGGPSAAEITRHHDADPDACIWVHGPPAPVHVSIVEHDERWAARFAELADAVRAALGDRVLRLDHVGSTSVPGLAAKDVIDLDLTVADPRDEAGYVPALTAAGWRHVLREPGWHEHRLLVHRDPAANLHVFGPDCPETIRHWMFRDWLRTHAEDRALYEDAKRAAAQQAPGPMSDYNARKQDTIREIYDRLFRSAGLLP